MPPAPSIRPAHTPDIPAILALLLTSFRQFPLFAYLYAPLDTNKDCAHDTVFFWRRRLLLELLDPAVTVLVAEVPESFPVTRRSEDVEDATERESWRMLEWVTRKGKLSQKSTVAAGRVVVGFAIWREREGHGDEARGGNVQSWGDWLRTSLLNLEGLFWSKLYQRRDQDPARYRTYLATEETLSEQFYKSPTYYLDNLCVDFRYQRLGIGAQLLSWGTDEARRRNLPVGTEASPKGEGLYRKAGFETVGVWKAGGGIELPVMRLAVP